MPGGGSEAVILPALMGGTEAVAAAGIPAFLSAALDSAAIGGIGSMLMGGNPLKGALFGGLTGGALNAIAPKGLGALFDGGVNPSAEAASGALSAAAPAEFANAPGINLGSLGSKSFDVGSALYPSASTASQFASSAIPAASTAAATSSPSLLSKFAPYAAVGLGSMALDKYMAPKQVGPDMQKSPSNPGPVTALNRQSQAVDPSSYYTSGGNRNYYSPYSMQPQFMARGGGVGLSRKCYANGGSSSASSSNIPRMVRGRGDGQSDSIPAMLSDGEFVVSAPVVSALGGGSNDAGAKKLSTLQKNVLKKHYTSGKPKKASGLGSYMH